MAVGVKNLKNRLSEYLRRAAAGETVLVTERDRVVAELVPPRPDRSPRVHDAVLADAVRRGWVTPPAAARGPLPPASRWRDGRPEQRGAPSVAADAGVL